MTDKLNMPALEEIGAFIVSTGITEGTFGKNAVNDRTFVERLRNGRVTYRVAQMAVDYVRRCSINRTFPRGRPRETLQQLHDSAA